MGVGTSLCSCLFASVCLLFCSLARSLFRASICWLAFFLVFRFQPQITDRIEMDADWKPVLKKRGISVLLAAPAAYSNGR